MICIKYTFIVVSLIGILLQCRTVQSNQNASVVIIGAGYAGLAAAHELINNHSIKDVIVLEALDRVGGRVYTIQENDEYFDMGAQFIHSTKAETFKLMSKYDNMILGARTRQKRDSEITYTSISDYFTVGLALTPNGTAIPRQVLNAWKRLHHDLQSMAYSYSNGTEMDEARAPVGEPLSVAALWAPHIEKFRLETEQTNGSEEVRDIFRKFNQILPLTIELLNKWEFGMKSLGETSVNSFAWEDSLPGEEFVSIELGKFGYHKLTSELVDRLPEGTILLNANVTLVDWGATGGRPDGVPPVTVKTSNGRVFDADHVIVTSSMGYLEAMQDQLFQPILPERKREAINAIGKGCVEKIFLLYENRWWDSDLQMVLFYPDPDNPTIHPDSIEENILLMISLPLESHPNVLELWLPFPYVEAFYDATDDDIMLAVERKFKDYFTGMEVDTIPTPFKILRTDWCRNPMFLNAYGCVFSTDFDRGGFIQADLTEPVMKQINGNMIPTILFAGEATSGVLATAHGAYRTGEREAQRIASLYPEGGD